MLSVVKRVLGQRILTGVLWLACQDLSAQPESATVVRGHPLLTQAALENSIGLLPAGSEE